MQCNPEFNLYIWKQRAEGQRPDRYTVGLWVNGTIQALCHIRPIDDAIGVIRTALEQAGHTAAVPVATAI